MSSLSLDPAVPPVTDVNSTSLKKAAVIDDAFDDVTEGEVLLSQFKEFFQVANEDNNLEKVLTRLGIAVPDFSEWEDDSKEFIEFLRGLWQNRKDPELEPMVNTHSLFAAKISKLEQVEVLCKNIEDQNIAIQKFTSTISDLTVFEQGEFVYIFMDYRLGTNNDDASIARAKKVSQDIYEICPKDKRPVTILMSSDPNVDEKVKENFRKDAMLEGVIRFSPKSDLVDKTKVSLLIRAYNEEFSSNHKLQEYIRALIAAAKAAQAEFEAEVTALRIEDYEFIQNSVLQNQQQPLGDYLAWLYGSHWANLLFKNGDLKEKQATIDKVISEKLPLHHTLPSEKLSEIFMTALFEKDLDQVQYHPWEGMIKLPYLHLGDVFTRDGSKEVFMILNPQCDLERPKEKYKSQSIFLIPGLIESLEDDLPNVPLKTDYFLFDEKRNRIQWNLRYLKAIPYDEFDNWIQQNQVERRFRLRLPFALDIQQQFTANMSRVGLPVAPPLTRNITLEVLIKNFDGSVATLIGESKDYAFLPLTRETKENVRLTLKFALDFKAALISEQENLVRLKGTYSEAVPRTLESGITKMNLILSSFDDWFFTHRGFPYPSDKPRTLANISISVALDFSIEDFRQDTKINTLFLINIITGPRQTSSVPSEEVLVKDIEISSSNNQAKTELNSEIAEQQHHNSQSGEKNENK